MSKFIRQINRKINNTVNLTKTLINGRTGLSPQVNAFLNANGNKIINSIEIVRNPVSTLITGALDVLSMGKVSALPYDKLFHLQMHIILDDGTTFCLEKNAQITISRAIKTPQSQSMPISQIPPNLTLNQFIENAKNYAGNRFIPYHSQGANCQNFVSDCLNGNGIIGYDNFIKQDASSVFNNNRPLRQLANTLTDLGNRGDILMQGGSVKTRRTKKTSKTSDELVNFYDHSIDFDTPYHNPSYSEASQPMKHSMRMCVVGASGSGKSNVVLNIIHRMNGTFEDIHLFTQNKSEPLYQWLEHQLKDTGQFHIYEKIDEVMKIDFDKIDKEQQHLYIFDDMCIERESLQKNIKEFFILGRKLNCSMIYISQSWFDIPMIIRKQTDYIILKKINTDRDIKCIIKDCSIGGLTAIQMMNMYKYCVSSSADITNFFYIQKSAPEELRFRKNFNEILHPQDF